MIRLENVSKEYIAGDIKTKAVQNVSFQIKPGDFTAIVGPSGSGKSTLTKIICGILKPSEGDVYFGEHNLRELSTDQISEARLKQIGQVFQDFRLLDNLNVMDNVLLPLVLSGKKITGETREEVLNILENLGIKHRKNHYPDKLSGGEKQRVGIARALVNRPQYIVADEPTGNLDSKNTDEIISRLISLNEQGIAIVVVTHDSKVADVAKKVIHFEQGIIQ